MDEIRRERRNDWIRVAILIALSAAIRVWLIAHTEVSARDSIGFMREAIHFQERPWREVLRTFQQMPGYPFLIFLLSQPVRAITGANCDSLVLSAQLVSVLTSLLTIVPMYFTGKLLFGRNAGLIAAAMFQALPVCVSITTDGLSEGAFFLFMAIGLYFAVSGLRRQSIWRFSASGIGIGLAYLTRPEGGELAICIAAVLVILALAAREVRRPSMQLAALGLGLLPFVAMYVGVTGELTRKPTSLRMLGGDSTQARKPVASSIVFATFWNESEQVGNSRSVWAAGSLFRETARASHYFGLLWATVGLWLLRRQIRQDSAKWLILLLAALHALLLWRMAIVIGYLSERHAMLLAFLGCFWAGAGVIAIGERLKRPQGMMAAALLFVVAAGLPAILKPMHANRAGHRQAGNWLAKNAGSEDEVIDPFCWAHFYAGCVFREGKDFIPPQHTRYVVIEQSSNSHSRLMMIEEAQQLAKRGTPVYHWPEKKPIEQARVVVYRVAATAHHIARN